MNKIILSSLFFCIPILAGFTVPDKRTSRFDFAGPGDPSLFRGFNYTPANVASPRHHIDHWVHYDSATTEFDLNLVKSLNLNQVRVFVPYAVYTEDKEALPGNGKAIVLTSASPLDENTLDEPTKVSPTTEMVKLAGTTLTRTFPGNSLTVIRVSTSGVER